MRLGEPIMKIGETVFEPFKKAGEKIPGLGYVVSIVTVDVLSLKALNKSTIVDDARLLEKLISFLLIWNMNQGSA